MATWEEATDENGRVYYYNTETQETAWEKPVETGSELVDLLKDTAWEQYTTEEGETYYYNTETQQSSWEVKLLIDTSGAAPELSSLNVIETDEVEEEETVIEELELKYPIQSQIINIKQVNSITPKQLELAKAAFVEMLQDGEVDSNWSFTKVMEQFIKDPRYWTIPDSLMKKELFEGYLMNKAEEEYQKSLNAKELFKTNFIKVLQNYDIKYYTRWKTCSNQILDEPIYSLASERLKIEIFNEYVKTLRQEHEKQEAKLKKQAIDELEDYFRKDLKLSMESSLEELLKFIESDQRFKDNKHFNKLKKLDILAVYDSLMKEIEFEFNQLYKFQKRQVYIQDKIARESFKTFLANLEFKITPKTTWFYFCSKVKDSPEFKNILGRSGSSPIDFFWDLLDDSQQFLNLQKNLIVSKFLELNLAKDEYDTFDKFSKLLKLQNIDNNMNKDELNYIYEKIQEDFKLETPTPLRESRSPKPAETESDPTTLKTHSIRDLSPGALRKITQKSSYKTQRDEVLKPAVVTNTKVAGDGDGDLDY